MTGLSKDYGKVRTFELKKGLFITPDNYEKFARTFDKALALNKKSFPFRNHLFHDKYAVASIFREAFWISTRIGKIKHPLKKQNHYYLLILLSKYLRR